MRDKEIADTLNVSLRTVEAHIYKALKFLRSKLKHLLYLIFLLFFAA
jgi:RNA polymerase sigma-70 factor (ECF subfamily)